jgi:hypothetical protein
MRLVPLEPSAPHHFIQGSHLPSYHSAFISPAWIAHSPILLAHHVHAVTNSLNRAFVLSGNIHSQDGLGAWNASCGDSGSFQRAGIRFHSSPMYISILGDTSGRA